MSGEEKGRLIMGVPRIYENIPVERIGVLLGSNGAVKREIEEKTKTIVSIDPDTGAVIIEPAFPNTTALELIKAQNVVRAVGYGFSPERAFRLLEDDQVLEVVDVRQY
ncbi:MAG: KH domain-containing protein, partial [Desulfurococcaceae archaeon]